MAELTDGTAELRVLVTTALGALPLENAIVSGFDRAGRERYAYTALLGHAPTAAA